MPVTHGGRKIRRLRWLIVAGVALYATFLCAAPFEHHDLSCELKTPQHCTSCTASVLSSNPEPPTVAGASHLVDAGRATAAEVHVESLLVAVRSTGRSPPAGA